MNSSNISSGGEVTNAEGHPPPGRIEPDAAASSERRATSDVLLALQIGEEQRARPGARNRPAVRAGWVAIPVAVAGAAVLAWAVTRERPAAVEVVTVPSPAAAAGGAPPLTAGGYVKHARVVNVVPRVAGVLAELRVAEGDVVHEGDVIATLESNDLAQEVAEARGGLRLAQANLAQLEAGARPEELAEAAAKVEALRATAERVERDRDRSRALAQGGVVAPQALDQLESEAVVARKTHDAAGHSLAALTAGPRREAIDAARAAAEAARARLGRAADLLERIRIHAPMSGRVLRKFLDVGAAVSFGFPYTEGYTTVAAGTPIVAIGQLEGLEATADIREADLGRITPGQRVEVRADAYPARSFPAIVARLAPRADRNKNTVEVTVRLDDPTPRELVHDMSVKLTFAPEGAAEASAGIAVPASALVTRDGAAAVFVVEDGRARLRRVAVGERRGDGALPVASGLVGGELVVVSRPEALEDGREVTWNGARAGARAGGGTP
jgi:HlyD family secretion protein